MKTTAGHLALPLLQAPAALAGTPADALAQTFVGMPVLPTVVFLLAALSGLALLFHFFASPAFKGWLGEKIAIRAALRKLDPAIYRHFHDLYLPRLDGKGTTRIAHVVVSSFGIFVIDTRKYRGWITDASGPDEWTQRIYHRISSLPNPLEGNQLNLGALRAFLGLPANRFLRMVFFIGGSGFRTTMPENVLTHGLLPWILSHDKPILGPTARQRAVEQLTELSRASNRRAAAHRHQLEPQSGRSAPLPNAMEREFASWAPPAPSKRHLLPPSGANTLAFQRRTD